MNIFYFTFLSVCCVIFLFLLLYILMFTVCGVLVPFLYSLQYGFLYGFLYNIRSSFPYLYSQYPQIYLTPTIQLPQTDSHSLYPHTQLHTEIKIQRLILSQNITEFKNSCCVTVRTARIIFVFIFIWYFHIYFDFLFYFNRSFFLSFSSCFLSCFLLTVHLVTLHGTVLCTYYVRLCSCVWFVFVI